MNIKDLSESLEYLFKAELTGFLWGDAGIGKTSIVKQYAKKMGYKFFPLYLGTQSDVGDILGLADFVKDKNGTAVATKFATPIWLKELIDYCAANPDSGGILFLDEFNRGRRDILAGMFALALDKTFHTIKLPKNLHIIAAGNPPTDDYNVTDVNETALMARFVHIKLEPTFDEWIKYAESIQMDSSLTGFIKGQPELLSDKRSEFVLPVKVDRRAYERLDRLFKLNTPAHLMENLMAGIIGLERTVAYQNYMRAADKPLSAKDVFSGKNKDKVTKWCDPNNTLSSLLNLTKDNVIAGITKRYDKGASFDPAERANLFDFIVAIPKDISYPMLKTLVQLYGRAEGVNGVNVFKEFFLDPLYEKGLVDLVNIAKAAEDKKPKDKAA